MIKINIEFNEQTGDLKVEGLNDNIILMYGLLELVRDIVNNNNKPKIEKVPDAGIVLPHQLKRVQ